MGRTRFCALEVEPPRRSRELFEAQLHLQGTDWAQKHKLGVLDREQDKAQQYSYLNSDEMVHAVSSAVALWAQPITMRFSDVCRSVTWKTRDTSDSFPTTDQHDFRTIF